MVRYRRWVREGDGIKEGGDERWSFEFFVMNRDKGRDKVFVVSFKVDSDVVNVERKERWGSFFRSRNIFNGILGFNGVFNLFLLKEVYFKEGCFFLNVVLFWIL